MIVVSFDEELREAFAAGQAAGMAQLMAGKKGVGEYFAKTPRTYEEWIESQRGRPNGPPIG